MAGVLRRRYLNEPIEFSVTRPDEECLPLVGGEAENRAIGPTITTRNILYTAKHI